MKRLWDWALMLDIGLVKTQVAVRTLFCVPAGMLVGLLIAHLFGLPAVLGLMIGAMPSFMTCLLVADPRPSRVAGRSAVVIVPFVVALSGSILLQHDRVLELSLLVAVLFVQFASMQWGPWTADAGGVLFMGFLCGLLLPLPPTTIVALSAIGAGSLAVTILLRTVFFRVSPYRSLARTRRALLGWATAVIGASLRVLDPTLEPRQALQAQRVLHRRLGRLQEVALAADGMLAAPGAGPLGQTAEELHRLLFDTHLAVDGLGRSADAVVRSGAADDVRTAFRRAYAMVLRGGGSRAEDAAQMLLARYGVTPSATSGGPGVQHLVHRTALLLGDLSSAARRWRGIRDDLPRTGDGIPFVSPVVLVGGRPAGAVPVLADTLATDGAGGPWRRWHLTASIRTAVQAAIAVAITEPLALLVSDQRFYWGVIGVMIVLAGTNTTHERIRKGAHRVVGNVVGGVIGVGLVALLGTAHPIVSMVICVVVIAIGTYGFGGVYSLWAGGLIIVLCQIYAFSGTFADGLVPLRIAENLLGTIVGLGVSLVVLPVSTRAVVRSAVRRQLAATRAFVLAVGGVADEASSTASGDDDLVLLRSRSRALDAATYQLDAVLKPMVRVPSAGSARRDAVTRSTLQSTAVFARSLAGGRSADSAVASSTHRPEAASAGRVRAGLAEASAVLATSIDALSGAVGRTPRATGRSGPRSDDAWVRISDALDRVDEVTPPGPEWEWVRDRLHVLGRIDGALVHLAEVVGLPVLGDTTSITTIPTRARRAASLVERRFASRA
jgi:hypothetical protein